MGQREPTAQCHVMLFPDITGELMNTLIGHTKGVQCGPVEAVHRCVFGCVIACRPIQLVGQTKDVTGGGV